jgi:hypothetical protein
VDPSAGPERRGGQAACIGQRVELTAAPVEHRGEIPRASRRLPQPRTLQQFHRHAAPRALLEAGADRRHVAHEIGGADSAGAQRLAGNAVPRNELEHEIRRGIGHRDQPCAELEPEAGLYRIRVVLQTWVHLPAIAAGSSPAGFRRLQHRHIRALLREVQRGGKAGVAGAHHRHRVIAIAFQRWRRRGRGRGLGIEAGRQGMGVGCHGGCISE